MLLTSGKWEEEREYWLGKLDPDSLPSGFEGDLREQKSRTGVPELVNCRLPAALTEKLLSASSGSHQGIYALLLSGVLYVLHRYTGEQTVTVGMPSGRRTGESSVPDQLTALQMDVDEALSFKSYIRHVSQTVQEARKYKHISYSAVIRLIKQDAEAAAPAFKTVVAMNTLHAPIYLQDAQATVTFYFSLEEDRLLLELLYERSMYSRRFIERIGRHFISFLDEALQDSSMPLSHVKMLLPEEVDELEALNSTAVCYPKDKTIHELFDHQAQRTPEWTALRFASQELTYGQLKERSDRLACLLRTKGIGRQQVAAIMTNRSPEMIVAILAVLKAGGAYVPIDPTYPSDRIAHMLNDSGSAVLLTQSGFVETVPFQGAVLDVDDSSIYEESGFMLFDVSAPEDAAYLIYTSGSTGLPKGVLVPHRSVVNFITGITECIPSFTEGKRIAAVTTLSFDIFVLETLLPLTQGLTVVIAGEQEQQSPALLNRWLADHQIQLFQATPSRVQLLLNDEAAEAGLAHVTTLMLGGEAFPEELLRKLRERCGQADIYNMYGPTETTVWSAVKNVTHASSITLGTPIANTQLYIVDSRMRQLPEGVAGELCIAGDGMAIGYWQREQLTAERFVPCPFGGGRMYRTGDLARRLPDGEIEFLGRIDNQVKIRGFRVELGEIESALLGMREVKAAVCQAKEDGQGNRILCAYYVSQTRITADELRSAIASKLPDYMLPSFYIPLDELPYTPNGKIDRKQLPDPYALSDRLFIGEPPASEQEERLLLIWKSVLEVEGIGVTDDFFNAGGHSLKALRLEVELEKAGFAFDGEDLYRYPTIRGFLNRIKDAPTGNVAEDASLPAGIEAFAGATWVKVAHDERIEPFNDVFYKECFYHSLFPSIRYFERSLLPLLVNDTVVYKFDEANVHFQVGYESAVPLYNLLGSMGIAMDMRMAGRDVVGEIKQAVRSNKLAIVRIDCYYATDRTETYQTKHWPHSWLVFGFDDSRQVFSVIEHDHIENLTYRKRWVSYEDTLQGHLGYLDEFGSEEPVYYELSAAAGKDESSDVNRLIASSVAAGERRRMISASMSALERFIQVVSQKMRDERFLAQDGERLLDALNQIVNAKLFDKYRYEQLLGPYLQLQPDVDSILEVWKQIRAKVAKSVFSAKLRPETVTLLCGQFDLAFALEREYADKLAGIIPDHDELEKITTSG
nr:non-ribosomal peptide synthetase [Paenibacillus roseus]